MRYRKIIIFFAASFCLLHKQGWAEKCDIDSALFTKGSVAMYGNPQPEKTLSLVRENIQHDQLLQFGQTGTFEGINPFISQGGAPFILKDYLYDSMMYRSPAEPFTLYPQIMRVSHMPDDRGSITFTVMEGAKFNDGSDITAKDVKFTFELLKEKGRYNYRIAYKDITAELLSPQKIRFNIHNKNRELPLILGLMPVLSHKNDSAQFDKQGDVMPLGAGAYNIEKMTLGKSITLKRNPSYYGHNRPVSCLRFHFDKVKISFFRNEQSAFESFKAGETDFFYENDLTRLNRAYHFPAIDNGDIIYHNIETGRPSGLYGFVFNTRRKPWDDPVLRRVISDIFAFDTLNKHYLYDTEQQINSVFMGSSLAYNADQTHDVQDDRRAILTKAFKRLKKAGYHLKDGFLHAPSGDNIHLKILLNKPREEKYALLLQWMLKDIGIQATLQTIDDALYQKRVRIYDYDMILDHRYVSLSPGTEQRNFWGCAGSTLEGTRNYAGICDKQIEDALDNLDKARSHAELHSAIHTIDKNIMQGHYYIPLQAKRRNHLFLRHAIAPSPYGEKYFYGKVK